MSSCVCKISFKSVQVCGGCCKMFRGLTFYGTQCMYSKATGRATGRPSVGLASRRHDCGADSWSWDSSPRSGGGPLGADGCVVAAAQHADSDLREDASERLVARRHQRPRRQLSHTRTTSLPQSSDPRATRPDVQLLRTRGQWRFRSAAGGGGTPEIVARPQI